jgi:hypothetical protein
MSEITLGRNDLNALVSLLFPWWPLPLPTAPSPLSHCRARPPFLCLFSIWCRLVLTAAEDCSSIRGHRDLPLWEIWAALPRLLAQPQTSPHLSALRVLRGWAAIPAASAVSGGLLGKETDWGIFSCGQRRAIGRVSCSWLAKIFLFPCSSANILGKILNAQTAYILGWREYKEVHRPK